MFVIQIIRVERKKEYLVLIDLKKEKEGRKNSFPNPKMNESKEEDAL